MNVSAAYQIHRWADTELYEHVALHEHGDGEVDVVKRCGLMHPEAVEFADCIVAGNWAIVRTPEVVAAMEVDVPHGLPESSFEQNSRFFDEGYEQGFQHGKAVGALQEVSTVAKVTPHSWRCLDVYATDSSITCTVCKTHGPADDGLWRLRRDAEGCPGVMETMT